MLGSTASISHMESWCTWRSIAWNSSMYCIGVVPSTLWSLLLLLLLLLLCFICLPGVC
jgi:hypothetical protein